MAVLDHNIQLSYGDLPDKLYYDILERKLKCFEEMERTPPPVDLDDVFIKLSQTSDDRDYEFNLSDDQYLAIMNIDVNSPPDFFFGIDYHVILRYHIQNKRGVEKKLCDHCYSRESKFYLPNVGLEWLSNGISYYKVRDHIHFSDGQKVLEDIVWDQDKWCAICIKAPLFSILTSKEECDWERSFHNNKRNYLCMNGGDDGYVEMKRIKPRALFD